MKITDMIQVLQDFKDGKDIECSLIGNDVWDLSTSPSWSFHIYDYRSVPKPKRIYIEIDDIFHNNENRGKHYIELTDSVKQKLGIEN